MKKLFIASVLFLSATASYAQPTASLNMHDKDAKPIASPRDSIVATLKTALPLL